MLFFDGRHRNLMPYLKRLREYPGGAESAKALAESWKTEYKRRPAMAKNLFGYARQKACYPSICTISHAARCSSSIRVKQNFSHGDNVVCEGSPSRIRMVRRISFGITTLPRSSILLTIPVAFIYLFLLCLNTSSVLLFAALGRICGAPPKKQKYKDMCQDN